VKGAFTGAIKDHWGRVKQAEGGTLFLDEIGELPLEIQPKLLRLLQEKEYERLGETTVRQSNVRVIAATNRDLKKCVAEGTFREDLYFRLNVISVEMPPLRSRPEDLTRFAESYASHFSSQLGRKFNGFSDAARRALSTHPWPGNLRELRNSIERAAILCTGARIDVADLPPDIREGTAGAPGATSDESIVAGAGVSLEQLEEAHIRRIVGRSASLAEAAQTLGIDQATLYRKRKKMGLE
jgi:NtrC-family two-component system response regulator AlgB